MIALGSAVRSTSVGVTPVAPAGVPVSVRASGEPPTATSEVTNVEVTIRCPASAVVSGPAGAVKTRLTVQEFAGVDVLFSTNGAVGQVPPDTTEYAELSKVRLKLNGVSDVLVTVTVCAPLVAPGPGSPKINGVVGAVTVGR